MDREVDENLDTNSIKDFSNLIHASSLRGRDTLGINSLHNNAIYEFKEYGDPRKIIKRPKN